MVKVNITSNDTYQHYMTHNMTPITLLIFLAKLHSLQTQIQGEPTKLLAYNLQKCQGHETQKVLSSSLFPPISLET